MFTNVWDFISVWYNLPFTILLSLCLVLAAFQLLGLGSDHDSDTDSDLDHDVNMDHNVDLEHDIDLDHAMDIDHNVEVEHDVDLDHGIGPDHEAEVDHDIEQDMDHAVEHEVEHSVDSNSPSTLTLLAFLGIGKAPLIVVLLILFSAVGILGWTLNGILHLMLGPYTGVAFAVVLPAAVIGASWVSAQVTRFIGRALPAVSSTATRAQTLVGRRGKVISPFVDQKYGLVHLRNEGGTLMSVFAVAAGTETARRGDEVVLVAYDAQQHRYSVSPLKPDIARPAGQ
jgi:membrane protein implicated in regulation of membrane protease activity